MNYQVERLSADHDRSAFDCGEPSLNDYLQRYARQNDERRLGRTYVAVVPDQKCVEGYYTLASGAVERADLPEKRLPRYPIPVILLARLAVDQSAQGQRLGEKLLLHALRRCSRISEYVGVYAVVVDALNERAHRFYLRYGFVPVRDDPNRLYLSVQEIKKLEL